MNGFSDSFGTNTKFQTSKDQNQLKNFTILFKLGVSLISFYRDLVKV